jgi:hypothetical protein
MTALLGIETLLTRSFLLDRVTTDQTKATYLASEGIEVMKSLLDHQVYDALANPGGIAGDPDTGGWYQFCGLGSGQTAYYQIDYMTTSCPTLGQSGFLGYDQKTASYNATPLSFDATGLYCQPGEPDCQPGIPPTAFTRIVKVTEDSTGNEIDVQSTVTWNTGSVTNQSLTLEDQFYNWNPGD